MSDDTKYKISILDNLTKITHNGKSIGGVVLPDPKTLPEGFTFSVTTNSNNELYIFEETEEMADDQNIRED